MYGIMIGSLILQWHPPFSIERRSRNHSAVEARHAVPLHTDHVQNDAGVHGDRTP